jgi:hypothetical protein
VLICGSLGKEGMDSARLHRTLADGLARSVSACCASTI